MNKYAELKNKQQKAVNDFPIFFAFNNKQFENGMKQLGLTMEDIDKIYSIGGGGYIRKTDSEALDTLLSNHQAEHQKAIYADTDGTGYIYDMFSYELGNHEYGYTRELEDTLNALDLTEEEINANQNLLNGLTRAIQEYDED